MLHIDEKQCPPNGGEYNKLWAIIGFGKHADKTFPQVMFHDPDWFFWGMKKGWFASDPTLAREAAKVDKYSKNIKIPAKYKDSVVKYFANDRNMFSHFIIISRDEAEYVGGNSIKQLEVIDMSVPHDLSAYDKSGYKRFVLSMKSCIFGNKSARITKQRAEEFFNDEANFVSDLR